MVDYAATKAALNNVTANLAAELGPEGIRVNAVAPGPVWTPLQPATKEPEAVAQMGRDTPLGRIGQPAELAGAYVFLASPDEASYVSGTVLGRHGRAAGVLAGPDPPSAGRWSRTPIVSHRQVPEPGLALNRPSMADNDDGEVRDMGAAENAEVVRRGYRAFNSGDLDALRDVFAENAFGMSPEAARCPGPSRGATPCWRTSPSWGSGPRAPSG